MKHYVVLIMLLTLSMGAAAQTMQTSTPSPPSTPLQTITIPGAVNTSTGTALIVAPPSSPVLVTPEVHLTTVNPAIGASNATPGNTAGAANATTALPVPPRIATTVPQYTSAVPSVTLTAPPQENAGVATTGTTGTGAPLVATNNPALVDRGVGSGGALAAGGDTGGKSLGELAREARQRDATANAHVYTNEDIQRLNQQPGITVGGMTGAAVGAGNTSGKQPEPSGNMPVVSEPSNPPQNPGVSRPVPPRSNPPQSQAVPPLASNEPVQMAEANPPVKQRRLPAGGTILPLMSLAGFLASGAGLLSR